MRLIDADNFQKELSSVWKWLVERDNKGYGTTHGETLDKVHDILINQPTAYNVEQVVEELEAELPTKIENAIDCAFGSAIRRAIEIVKEGGKNDI